MSEPDPKWKVLSSEIVYSARPFLEISRQKIELPDGRVIPDFHHAWVADYALICAETSDGQVVMERLYKHGAQETTIIFPGGGINRDEAPIDAAQRELLEETGYVANEWLLLQKLVVHANYGCGYVYFYHAKGARLAQQPAHDDLEDIQIELHPRSELAKLVQSGQMVMMDCMAMLGALSLTRQT